MSLPLTPIPLGAGFAPAVTIVDGLVYVAFGTRQPEQLVLVTLTPAGALLRDETLPGGNYNAFPRFDGPWLVYRTDEVHGYVAAAVHVVSGQRMTFDQAHGTYGLTVNAALERVAYEQQRPEGWRVLLGHLATGQSQVTAIEGAPDGLDTILSADHITCRKDTRGDVAGMFSPVRAGDLTVGMRPESGIAVLLEGEALRVLLEGNCADPRAATDGTTYAVVCWGEPGGVRLVLATRAELATLPLASAQVVFAFNHAVMVCPFKDPEGTSGAAAEIVVNQTGQSASRPYFVAEDSVDGRFSGPLLGIYTEGTTPTAALQLAERQHTRVLVCHDAQTPWTRPAGLRPWDIPMIELYWYLERGETLPQAVTRWRRDRDAMLAAWPGDCAVCPMFYCRGGAKGGDPPEILTVDQVRQSHAYLSEIVNASPRITIIAPFAFARANGITAHPELRAAFDALRAAAPGLVALTPIGAPPVDPPTTPPKPPGRPPEPTPPAAPSPYRHHKGVPMVSIDGKTVVLRGFKGLLLRPDAPNTGIWASAQPPGWRGGMCDKADAGDQAAHHVATKLPNGRYTFTHVQNRGLLGADAGQYTPSIDREFYYKPDGNTDAGELEQFRVYDGNENGAIEAQCEHVTDDQHPSGAGKKFFAYPLAVEVV